MNGYSFDLPATEGNAFKESLLAANQPVLSICICALAERIFSLRQLHEQILSQGERKGFSIYTVSYTTWIHHVKVGNSIVEVLVIIDNKEMTTGAKRNLLYSLAKGKYVCSVDDDDEVSPWYIEEILQAAEKDPDAIAMNGTMTTDGWLPETWDISRLNPYSVIWKSNRTRHYLRYHNHLSPIRRTIALQYPFPDKYDQEDFEFATALHRAGAIKTEVKILRPMYHYKYNSKK